MARARRLSPISELDAGARRRVWIAAAAAGIAAAVLTLVAGTRLSRPLFDLWQNVSPPPPASRLVHVVVIDADSLKSIGGWPWSRFYLARLVEEISRRGASAIGLDLLMPEPDRLDPERFAGLYGELSPSAAAEVKALPSMDAVFARVIGRSPVVLARAGALAQSFDALDQDAAPLPPEVSFAPAPPKSVLAYPHAVANLPLLDGAAAGHGLVNGDPDDDGVVRRVPLVARVAGAPTASFAVELVRVAKGAEQVGLTVDGDRLAALSLAGHSVPASADGQLTLRFGDWRSIRTTAAADLIRKGLPDNLFRGQIVLVGLTSAGSSDVVTTPRARETYGVFVQAQAVQAVLEGQGLARPAWARWAEWAVGVSFAVGAALAFARAPVRAAAAATGAAAVALAVSWGAFLAGLLIDPFPAILPAVGVGAATVAALFVEGRALQARLRTALEEERLAAARVAGELAAAADIQLGMLTPRDELARLADEVEVDAILQPARNVGGDLYDAFRLDEKRLCFLVGDVTGKGVPAALFMALAKSLARSLIVRHADDLVAAVGAINAELSRDNREAMALTLLVGVLRLADGRIDLLCAGHENPLIARDDGAVRELVLRGGPPLCVDAEFPYGLEACDLGLGETLLVFSDGLTEAQNPQGRLLTREALLEAASAGAMTRSASGAVDALAAAVRAFEAGSEPSDDLTILGMRRPPPT